MHLGLYSIVFMGMWKVEQTGTKQGVSIGSALEANVWMDGFFDNTVAVSFLHSGESWLINTGFGHSLRSHGMS